MTKETLRGKRLGDMIVYLENSVGAAIAILMFVIIVLQALYLKQQLPIPKMEAELLYTMITFLGVLHTVWGFVVHVLSRRSGMAYRVITFLLLVGVGYFGYLYVIFSTYWVVVAIAVVLGLLVAFIDLRVLGKDPYVVTVIFEEEILEAPVAPLEEHPVAAA